MTELATQPAPPSAASATPAEADARTILITGCSSGIGEHAAHTLRSRGWRVFAACRDRSDCDRLVAAGFESPRIDYTDPYSIRDGLEETLEATGGRLDALFNNGAHALNGAVEDLPVEGLRAIFEANFFGWHDLTRRAIPAMRAGGGGHVVQCSSVLGMVTTRWRGAYAATKHALEALTDSLRLELRDTGIRVVLIQPGPISTKFRINGIPHFERWIDWKSSPHRSEYENAVIPRLRAPEGVRDRFELPPDAVSRALVRALDSRDPDPRYYVTSVTHIAGLLRRILSSRMIDRVAARL